MKTKVCSKCGVEKPLLEFHKSKNHKYGVRNECKGCQKIIRQTWQEKQNKYYGKIKYSKLKNDETSQQRYRETGSKKDKMLQRLYGITLDKYNQMFNQQNGCCAICGKHQSEQTKALCVDHCHKTGKVRSLLCFGCNNYLSVMENNEFVKKARQYLKNHSQQ